MSCNRRMEDFWRLPKAEIRAQSWCGQFDRLLASGAVRPGGLYKMVVLHYADCSRLVDPARPCDCEAELIVIEVPEATAEEAAEAHVYDVPRRQSGGARRQGK